ncbi:hypothetical protein [Microbaculum marinum]|uniref:Tetratricopeptide repeat protein n=1 Tax=Microbaculum marinum TaxID=1764581 RepID=A0AAW9RRQ7_9HYPH
MVQSPSLAAREPVTRQPPTENDISAELERVLSSPHLGASERRRAFLRYVVEESLAGRADRLKGYCVAVAVFGRDETFDPQADPVVRLEARRLRRDLDSYYVGAGSNDPLRISIPKGSYVPHFDWLDGPYPHPVDAVAAITAVPPPEPETAQAVSPVESGTGNRRPYVLAGALLAVAVIVAATVWHFAIGSRTSGPEASLGPAVIVRPFEPMGDGDENRYLAAGISEDLVGNLMRFPSFRLYIPPPALDKAEIADSGRLAREFGIGYVIDGSVRADAATIRVAAQLLDARSGQVLWTGVYDRPLEPEALIGVQSDLAEEIATALGQPYGVVNTDLMAGRPAPAVSHMQSYLCVLRAYAYRRGFTRQEFDPVLTCLEAAVRRDPGFADAWAMLGWLRLDAGRYEFAGSDGLKEAYARAYQAAAQAVALEPDNTLALKALSSITHYMGRFEEAERLARRAVELNPNDPDALAQLGWRLAVRGRFEEGIPVLRHAIERTANPPGWYFHLVAIDLYLNGSADEMLRVAERSAVNGSGISQALIAIAAGETGDADTARQALDAMAASGPLARDPAAYLRRHGATQEIVAALMAGLDKARRIAAAH